MKPRETVKLFTNKRNVPRPSKGFFNFYPAPKGVLKVKGYNFGEKDVVLDRELEGYDYVNPYGITNKTTVLEAFKKLSQGGNNNTNNRLLSIKVQNDTETEKSFTIVGYDSFSKSSLRIDRTLKDGDLENKVVLLSYNSVPMEICIVSSNFRNIVNLDYSLKTDNVVGFTMTTIQTYLIPDTSKDTIVAAFPKTKDIAIVLPAVNEATNRRSIKIYNEDIEEPFKTFIVTKGSDGITSIYMNKYDYLESINEQIELLSDYVQNRPHYDIINTFNVKISAVKEFIDDYTLTTSTDPQKILLSYVLDELFTDKKLFPIIDNDGFLAFRYTSLVPRTLSLRMNLTIERTGTTAIIDTYWNINDNLIQANTLRMSNNDIDSIISENLIELHYGDVIYPMVSRSSSSGTIKILANGSSVIIK